MLHMFTNNCKFRSCFALGQAHDPTRAHVGRSPNFTNHAGHETQMMRRETVPKILNTIINIFKFSRTEVAKPHQFCAQVHRFTMQES